MKLSIVASNRDRFKLNDNASQWFLKSIQWQDFNDFELVIADGGSSNYNELQAYFGAFKGNVPVRLVQYKIGEPFERAKLNNVGIRQAKGEYIMCTDVDVLFGKSLISELVSNLNANSFVESRTMYWKYPLVNKIYKGELDPYNNLEACKSGRIKKRTTAGGRQCTSVQNWNKLRGYNEEEIIGWGSEDVELLERVMRAGMKILWMGESIESIMLFHQPHPKKNMAEDLKCQERNKRVLKNVRGFSANPHGWGGNYN